MKLLTHKCRLLIGIFLLCSWQQPVDATRQLSSLSSLPDGQLASLVPQQFWHDWDQARVLITQTVFSQFDLVKKTTERYRQVFANLNMLKDPMVQQFLNHNVPKSRAQLIHFLNKIVSFIKGNSDYSLSSSPHRHLMGASNPAMHGVTVALAVLWTAMLAGSIYTIRRQSSSDFACVFFLSVSRTLSLLGMILVEQVPVNKAMIAAGSYFLADCILFNTGMCYFVPKSKSKHLLPSLIELKTSQSMPTFSPVDRDLLNEARQSSMSAYPRSFHSRSNFFSYGSTRNSAIPFVGLGNQGATCYMNSLLQPLFFIEPFRRAIIEMAEKFEADSLPDAIYGLGRVFHELETSPSSVSTIPLTNAFRWSHRELWSHQDIQEFSRLFLHRIENDLKGSPRENLVEEIFGGKTVSTIKCSAVDFVSSQVETFHGSRNLHEALDKFTAGEKMTGDNQFDTEKFGHQDAVKTVKFQDTPSVLSFQLQRVVYNSRMSGKVKVNGYFAYPLSIDMCPYMEDCSEPQMYHLFGVMTHTGSANFGHYRAFVRAHLDDEWFEFNDSRVSPASNRNALSDNYGGYLSSATAYILFYVREADADEVLKRSQVNDVITEAV